MKIQTFLEHHGIRANPFAEEDAQTDPVFKEHCIASTYHPTWDKIYGDPAEPSTSIVFGEKGSGKTAMRLQIARHLEEYNRQHPDQRLFVIEYDDFNPFLDRFRDKLSRRRRRADRVLAEWKLWDHMDAILSLGVTGLVDRILDGDEPLATNPPYARPPPGARPACCWPPVTTNRRPRPPRAAGTGCGAHSAFPTGRRIGTLPSGSASPCWWRFWLSSSVCSTSAGTG